MSEHHYSNWFVGEVVKIVPASVSKANVTVRWRNGDEMSYATASVRRMIIKEPDDPNHDE